LKFIDDHVALRIALASEFKRKPVVFSANRDAGPSDNTPAALKT
jgi:hypothetical protein